MAIPMTDTRTSVVLVDNAAPRRTFGSKVEMRMETVIDRNVNIYVNPELAVLREVVSNGIDATVLAGSDAPVEITLPTMLNPMLTIADHGVGMSIAEVEDHFLAFGCSSKTGTNDQIGEYGSGAKAPWQIATSFLVTTVKDGRTSTVKASSVIVNGELEHEVLVDDVATDAPNGTTISIPVDVESANWEALARSVASTHRDGAVLIDGAPAASVYALDGWIGDVLVAGASDLTGESLVVISGGAQFTLPTSLRSTVDRRLAASSAPRGEGAVIVLPIGSFNKTSGRDSLVDTAVTRAALDRVLDAFADQVAQLNDEITGLAVDDFTAGAARRREVLGELSQHTEFLPLNATLHADPLNPPRRRQRTRYGMFAGSWTTPDTAEFTYETLTSEGRKWLLVTDVPEGAAKIALKAVMEEHYPNITTVFFAPAGAAAYEFTVTINKVPATTGFTMSEGSFDGVTITYAELLALRKAKLAELAAQRGTSSRSKADHTYPVDRFMDGEWTTTKMELSEVASLVAAEGYRVVMHRDSRRYWTFARESDRLLLLNLGSRRQSEVVQRTVPSAILEDGSDAVALRKSMLGRFWSEVSRESLILALLEHRDQTLVRIAHRGFAATFTGSANHLALRDAAALGALVESYENGDIDPSIAHEVSALRSISRWQWEDARRDGPAEEVSTILDNFVAAFPMLGTRRGYDSHRISDIDHAAAYVAATPPVSSDSSGA